MHTHIHEDVVVAVDVRVLHYLLVYVGVGVGLARTPSLVQRRARLDVLELGPHERRPLARLHLGCHGMLYTHYA